VTPPQEEERTTTLLVLDIARDFKVPTQTKENLGVSVTINPEFLYSAKRILAKLLIDDKGEGVDRPELIERMRAKNVPLDVANAALDELIDENCVYVFMDMHHFL